MSADIVSLASRHQGSPSKSSIADGIRARIRSGELLLGARISDKAIASELGVSRTPVREALVQLQTEGLVVMRPQSGTFVTDLTATDVHQICATRCVLEVGALRLGGEGIPRDRLAQLGLLVGQASIALTDGDLARCDGLDCDFHEALIATSANPYLVKSYASISDLLRALRQRMPRTHERMARAIAQHRHIIDLWAAGRVDGAAAELGTHVGNVERLLTAARLQVSEAQSGR